MGSDVHMLAYNVTHVRMQHNCVRWDRTTANLNSRSHTPISPPTRVTLDCVLLPNMPPDA